jgi:hypothetical protein
MPTGGTPAGRRVDRLGRETAACNQPRDQRVGVPHLPRAPLVPAPDERGNLRNGVEHSLRRLEVVRESPRALDRLAGVRDASAAPAAHLVAEDSQPPCPATAHGTCGDHAALRALPVADRRHLDHVRARRHAHLESRVVEVAGRPPREPRRHGFEDAPVHPHRPTARAEREPVEVDPAFRCFGHPSVKTEPLQVVVLSSTSHVRHVTS